LYCTISGLGSHRVTTQLQLINIIIIIITATAYGLDGPGIESRWGEIFRTCPDRP